MHKITVADLPAPFATTSASNSPQAVPRPADAKPQALPGYSVALYAEGLDNPRLMRTAPNGDIFVAESRPGRVKVMRGRGAAGRAQTVEVFATGLSRPFGIAFYPPGQKPTHVYIGNTDSVVRFPYQIGDLKARGPAETIAAVPTSTPPGRGHWSRDITGFVADEGHVWGRSVGVAMAPDGALLVSDDGSNSIWRVSYTRK